MERFKIAKNIGETNIFDENSPILFDDKIDTSAYISYVWLCEKCKRWNIRVKADKENCINCMECAAKYDFGKVKFMNLDLVNALRENPLRVDLQKFRGHGGNPRGSIEAHPMLFFSWLCPSCNHNNPTIPRHDGVLIACDKCKMRFFHKSIRYTDADYAERYVNAGIQVFNL